MKKLIGILCVLCTLLITATAFGQSNPVHWVTKAEKTSADTYKIYITATYDNPWHIYSQSTPEGGPVPTTITFNKNPLLTIVGKPEEKGDLKITHDPNFGVDVKYYANKVTFIQTVKVHGNVKTNVSGTVNFMVCNDQECLPPSDQVFSVELK